MKPTIPAIALLAFALAACNAERTPAEANDAASPASPAADAMANDPAAPPAMDQPAQDLPPATAPAPGGINQAPDLGLVRMDGYGDMRFGMSADEAKKAWGGELKGVPAEEGACYYLTPKWVTTPSDFAFMIENGKFVRYDVGNDQEVAPGGGRRGMTEAQIDAAYPGRVAKSPHKYVEGGKYLRVEADDGSDGVLVFETDAAGNVSEWHAGLAPQVDWIEGCS